MTGADREEIDNLFEKHQHQCLKSVEAMFTNINGSLTSLHNKFDSIQLAVTQAAIAAAKVEERLAHGIKHFELLDKQVEELQKEDKSIWQTISRVALWVAVGGAGGVGAWKFIIGG